MKYLYLVLCAFFVGQAYSSEYMLVVIYPNENLQLGRNGSNICVDDKWLANTTAVAHNTSGEKDHHKSGEKDHHISGEKAPHHSGEKAPHHSGEKSPHHSGEKAPHHSGEKAPHHSGVKAPHHSGEKAHHSSCEDKDRPDLCVNVKNNKISVTAHSDTKTSGLPAPLINQTILHVHTHNQVFIIRLQNNISREEAEAERDDNSSAVSSEEDEVTPNDSYFRVKVEQENGSAANQVSIKGVVLITNTKDNTRIRYIGVSVSIQEYNLNLIINGSSSSGQNGQHNDLRVEETSVAN
ncbi:uncharacterized protein [Diabrotica undecimpunctata]|uniref:uncharacterized protein n=1 Tax=Diabrotica undecimpunctata TaxID=50387 RepID=UPI003B6342B8